MEIIKKIELLAPARDPATGRVAVDAGADAVYIGGPGFGARRAAGNSFEDIAALVRYARPFGVRVYATLNTLLFEDELDEARRVACGLVEAGVDALIVQDMAFMRMGINGMGTYNKSAAAVAAHASTQTSNIVPEEVAFLGRAGFRRVILERALSLEEIRAIRAACPAETELEVFVHGAICVGYSGRCFLSRSIFRDKQAPASLCSEPKSSHTPQYAAVSAPSQASHLPISDEKLVRSGNRGDCSQPCRLAWDLTDGEGRVLLKGKHLLSVRDLDLGARLGDLLDAGVSSFKIEGRLKDAGYVRNIVSHYRRLLDEAMATRPGLQRASVGTSTPDFTPDPAKSFTRGGTGYFIDGARRGVASFDTPKAMGEFVGVVGDFRDKRASASLRSKPKSSHTSKYAAVSAPSQALHMPVSDENSFYIENLEKQLSPGDGICFFAGGELCGTNVNRVEGARIYPNNCKGIVPGTEIYRNYDHAFVRSLDGSRMKRRIGVVAQVEAGPARISVTFTDETGVAATVAHEGEFAPARDPAKMAATVRAELAKSGDTIFEIRRIEISEEQNKSAVGVPTDLPFVPVSLLARMRREGLGKLLEAREGLPPERNPATEDTAARFPRPHLTSAGNVTNSLAERFWRDHGITEIEPALELRDAAPGDVVMRTRYCIRREIGECLKEGSKLRGDLFLERGRERWRLAFDCNKCEMTVEKI